jgi:hypothetical protein
MKMSKKQPGPTSYEFKKYIGTRKFANASRQGEKTCCFIDDAKWMGKQTPGHTYKISFSVTDVKPKAVRIVNQSERQKKQDNRLERLTKDKSYPSPGDYD